MTQEEALRFLKSGRNVFLTGSAGTGKTFVLNQYIRYLKERRIPVSITASTGIAATHLEGTTIHAWSGIGIRDNLSTRQLAAMKAKKYLKKNLEKCKVLIIDEISMLHKNQFDMVNRVLKYFRETDEPFGGVQLVLSGDFFQLPPVGNSGESSRDKFAFMSDSWLEANLSICYLTEQFRQTDNSLNDILNEIRTGTFSQQSYERLKHHKVEIEDDDLTRLYTHNADVDRINRDHLKKLKGEKKQFNAHVKGNMRLAETVKKSIMAPENLELRVGAKVMFVKNNYEKGYLNGTLGEVVRYNTEDLPVIRLQNGYEITAEPEDWRIEDEAGKLLVSYKQVPLRLAWAITVHKSQGMTLDAAEMDLSKTFEKGQGYVALSRIKSLSGLKLLGINDVALQVDPLALRADLRFKELAEEALQTNPVNELEAQANQFIKRSGGVTDKDEIEFNKKELKKGKLKKRGSTYLITKELIEQGFSLEEIAIQRNLSKGTITTHLIKIKQTYPHTDISRFKPSRSVMTKVRKAYEKLQGKDTGNTVSLKPLFEHLNGAVSYADIKLALVFL